MIVIDASVWVSTLIDDDAFYEISLMWVRKSYRAGEGLVAPILLLAEVAGAVARRHRRSDAGHHALVNLLRDPMLSLVNLDIELTGVAARIAADLSLRGADSVYVALAYQRQLPLVTWDREQLSRATAIIDVRTPSA